MFARLTAKVIFAAAAIAMAFFGIGFLGMALAAALVATLGTVGGYALAGVVFLVPPLLWAPVVAAVGIMATSLLVTTAHWPTDVVGGLLTGLLVLVVASRSRLRQAASRPRAPSRR